jgi:hypothetical protein
MILLKLDPEKVFAEHPEAKKEFLAWAMGDHEFLASFVELIATGWSPEDSTPWRLDELRQKLHEAMGDTYHAEAMRRVQEAEEARRDERNRALDIELRLKAVEDMLPQVFKPGGEHKLGHLKESNRRDCPACRFIAAIKGEEL